MYLLISRKALKSLMENSDPGDQQQPSTERYTPFTKPYIYIYRPPHPLWSSSSELPGRVSAQLLSSVSSQIKLKLATLTLNIFISVDTFHPCLLGNLGQFYFVSEPVSSPVTWDSKCPLTWLSQG